MFNEIWWLVFAVVNFCLLLICYKLFGKTGLFVWIGMGTALANVQVVKTVELFGIIATLGNIMYGTTFLSADIINEKYGKNEAKKAVWIGFFSLFTMTIIMQMALRFVPHEFDIAQESLETIFGLQLRVAIGSLTAYIISQYINVHIFSVLKSKLKDKGLWIRNSVSTLIGQFIDTFIFCAIAFLGVFPTKEWLGIVISTYVIKGIVSIFDTPFMYIARKLKAS